MLPLLEISPVLGRNFLPEEDAPHGPPVAMISYALWQGHYGGDRGQFSAAGHREDIATSQYPSPTYPSKWSFV